MNVVFTKTAYQDYRYWERVDQKKFQKIRQLIRVTSKNPFSGIGKPESLKGDLQGFWSRRIDRQHRLVYCIENQIIEVISCRYHY